MKELKILWMYHDIMDLYGDKGNMLVLTQRCRKRGIEITIDTCGIGEQKDVREYDLLFLGGVARGLGVRGEVSSPTFALVHEHAGKIPLYHFDMYRVTSWDDLYSTGFFDYLESDGVLVIEWSENIEGALPETAVRIVVSPGEMEDQRIFEIEGLEL